MDGVYKIALQNAVEICLASNQCTHFFAGYYF
jgi:hypothetical protein